MKRIDELVKKCKCEVMVSINEHTSNYETVQERLDVWVEHCDYEIDKDVMAEMIKRDTTVCVQFYPHTPIGFHKIIHYDLGLALDEALKCFD